MARQIVDTAPDRTPGSEGDAAIADFVARASRGRRRPGLRTELHRQLEGDDVELRNVILTLPGESARSVVVLAARDSAGGPGAASSAAATATLLELVDKLRTPVTPRRWSSCPPTGQRRRRRGARVRRALPAARPDRRRGRAVAARLRHPAPALRARRLRRAAEPLGPARAHRRAGAHRSDRAPAAAGGHVRRPGAAGAAQRARRAGRADRARHRRRGPLLRRGAAAAGRRRPAR